MTSKQIGEIFIMLHISETFCTEAVKYTWYSESETKLRGILKFSIRKINFYKICMNYTVIILFDYVCSMITFPLALLQMLKLSLFNFFAATFALLPHHQVCLSVRFLPDFACPRSWATLICTCCCKQPQDTSEVPPRGPSSVLRTACG